MGSKNISSIQIKKFQNRVLAYIKNHRRSFPWRNKVTLYTTLVSEIMLQQTQADRVAGHFTHFIKQFPSIWALADASVTQVIRAWQGLGYNRRALFLHRCAQKIVQRYKGVVPKTVSELDDLPGIGYATACSIIAFGYNKPVVFIETNIRSVYIYHFFKNKKNVADSVLIPLIRKTLYAKNPRLWYSALMDYGAMLKKKEKNPSRKSAHYTKQKPFKGSTREIRGCIVRGVSQKKSIKTIIQLLKDKGFSDVLVKKVLIDIKKEGFIKSK